MDVVVASEFPQAAPVVGICHPDPGAAASHAPATGSAAAAPGVADDSIRLRCPHECAVALRPAFPEGLATANRQTSCSEGK